MPTADGSSAYLIPYDGDIQLLEDTASPVSVSSMRSVQRNPVPRPSSSTTATPGQLDPSNSYSPPVL